MTEQNVDKKQNLSLKITKIEDANQQKSVNEGLPHWSFIDTNRLYSILLSVSMNSKKIDYNLFKMNFQGRIQEFLEGGGGAVFSV